MRTPLLTLLAVALALASSPARADGPARAAGEAAQEEEHFDAVHHTADGPFLDFEPVGRIELPRLLLVRRADGRLGFDAFAGTAAALRSGRYRAVAEVEEAHAGGTAEAGGQAGEAGPRGEEGENLESMIESGRHLEAALVPAGGGAVVVDFSITRHVFFLLLTVGLLLLLLLPMGGRYRRGVGRTSAPRGLLQNLLETLVVYVREEIAKPNLGTQTRKYLPYLLTVFFFILTANLIGLFPWAATATSNIAVTAVLAVCTFVVTQASGTKDYWKHIFWPPGVPTFVKPILVPIEIAGVFTKPFALAIRLFANMTAGHLVILNFVGLIFIIKALFGDAAGWATSVPALLMTVFVYALELLVALIQAYVFTMLSALFIGMATAEHEHDHDASHEHDLTPHDVAVSRSTPLVSGHKIHPERERTVGTEAAMAFSS